jgi:hypothetical protein
MAAKDYKICPAQFNAYITKVSKRNPNKMTDDQRIITENEILMLIDWYLDKELEENQTSLSFESQAREGKRIRLSFVDKNKAKQLWQQLKKIILLAFIALVMVGCDNDRKPLGYTYLELDSCEYIMGLNQLAHKGNCRFCKERRQKELKELIEQLKEK